MGRSFTPKYRLEIYDGRRWESCAWSGRVTPKRLEDYVLKFGKSLELGGVNAHISIDAGFIPYPTRARIVRNLPDMRRTLLDPVIEPTPIADWKAPMFMVW